MEKYKVAPLNTKEVPPGEIQDALSGFSPLVAGIIRGRRLIQLVDTRIFYWEVKRGSPSSPWQPYGPLIQLKRAIKPSYCSSCLAAYGKFVIHESRERCPARAR